MSVMSVVSMRRRALAAQTAPTAPTAVLTGTGLSLADLTRGDAGVVAGIEAADPAAAHRLLDLGFVPGTPVEVVRRAPLRDPVVYRVAGYEIALRRAQAACIRISPLT